MKIQIKDKQENKVITTINIPFSQNPFEAVLNCCYNNGISFISIEWEGK